MTSSAVAMLVPYARPNNIIAVGVILPVLCIIAFMLRIYARSTRKQILGVDDWLLIPAVVEQPDADFEERFWGANNF